MLFDLYIKKILKLQSIRQCTTLPFQHKLSNIIIFLTFSDPLTLLGAILDNLTISLNEVLLAKLGLLELVDNVLTGVDELITCLIPGPIAFLLTAVSHDIYRFLFRLVDLLTMLPILDLLRPLLLGPQISGWYSTNNTMGLFNNTPSHFITFNIINRII